MYAKLLGYGVGHLHMSRFEDAGVLERQDEMISTMKPKCHR